MSLISSRSRDSRRTRYLVAGAWNTTFGYVTGIFLYSLLRPYVHLLLIAAIGNVLAISMSFVTYKLYVFRTTGHWMSEYLRAYVVYGGTALVGTGILWLLVDGLLIPFWIAQGLVILVTVAVSYVSHSKFTFRRSVS